METKRYLIILSLIISISFGENSTSTNLLDQTSTESGITIPPSSSFTSTSSSQSSLSRTTVQIQQSSTQQQNNVGGYFNNLSQKQISTSSLGTVTPSISFPSVTFTSITTAQQQYEQVEIPSEPLDEHILLGSSGPDQKEILGIQKALDWLKEKRLPDYGWANDTHMVILAKELSGARDSTDQDSHIQIISDLEDLLSIKQMEVEILSMLDRYYGNDEISIPNNNLNLTFHSSRHHTVPKPINADKIARYVLALGSLCKDPKRFYGHDLVATLQHHEPVQDQEFALATLAVCSSAAHVRKRQIRRLLDIASGGPDQSVDTVAMVILALRCIVTDHRHRHLQHFVRRPTRGLASTQDQRGGFGSLRSTALAIQALQDIEPDPASTWNRSAASKWILDRQRSDGGWTEEPLQDGQDPSIGIGLTADIILALGWKGLGAVRALQCDNVLREPNDNPSENGEPKLAAPVGLPSSAEESEPKNVSYTYTLWVGSNVTESFSLSLISLKNTSFFRAMKQAAELDARFAFEAREWPNGHYVHTLAGKKEEPRGYNYWLLYRLPELPDPSNPPGNQLIAPVGVDELMVEDGEHYLYWYKKL